MSVGTFILTVGRWGDLYGRKLIYVVGWGWFALWSLIAAFSTYSYSVNVFDARRGLSEIGSAKLASNAIAIV